MKKLIFILFMLPMLAVCQQHMMFVLASQESSEWKYEGTLTVGHDYYYSSVELGWVHEYGWNDSNYGSISPEYPQIPGFAVATMIMVEMYNIDDVWYYKLWAMNTSVTEVICNTIEIDGVEYTGFNETGELMIDENPFPATGQTCTIKLK